MNSKPVRLGIQAADGPGVCTEHGVIHRDFKAANVIVGERRLAESGRFRLGPEGRSVAGRRDDGMAPWCRWAQLRVAVRHGAGTGPR